MTQKTYTVSQKLGGAYSLTSSDGELLATGTEQAIRMLALAYFRLDTNVSVYDETQRRYTSGTLDQITA
jgi:hypothetical protein